MEQGLIIAQQDERKEKVLSKVSLEQKREIAKIGMSATYLSAIETGKRNIPSNMEELLFTHYNFSEKDII